MELQDSIKIRKSYPGKTIETNFAIATVTKSFQMTSENTSLTSPRKAFQTPDLDC